MKRAIGRTGRWRLAVGIVVAGLLVLGPAAPALAHGGDDSDQSRVLVLDALAYLANKPAGYMDMVTDKVDDALDAPEKDGVDLSKVAAAKQALAAGDMADMNQVRDLLQTSLQPMTDPVVGDDPGTTVVADPMPGHTAWDGLDIILVALSGLALLVGLGLARRWRPTEPLRILRAKLITRGGAR